MTSHSLPTPPVRRAFALPLVTVLIVVATSLVLAALTRHSAQMFTVQRQVDAYAFHHASKGAQEAIQAWITGNSGLSIEEALDENRHAFDLEIDERLIVSVSFFDAQGSALAGLSGLSGDQLQTAAAILEELRLQEGQRARLFVRDEGPLAVSLPSAPREVIDAICRALLGAARGDSAARELLAIRDEPDLTETMIQEAILNADVDQDAAKKLRSLFDIRPVLYRVVAQTRSLSGSGPVVTDEGLAIVQSRARGSGGITRNSMFLSWNRLPEGTTLFTHETQTSGQR